MEKIGVGEIIVNLIDNDEKGEGYDKDFLSIISKKLTIPIVASGGAGTIVDFKEAVDSGADAVAAGSMFVYHGPHKAVLISYPRYETLIKLFNKD